jgi:DNA-3-methyladenine glycosylase
MNQILTKQFYLRPTVEVAKDLLGKFLVIEKNGKKIAHMITEVEAYDGFEDKASHAAKGKTPRTKVMFEEGGIWYVYFIYGMYEMLNIVIGPREYPAAILIRGVEGINGPGKLTKAYGITREFNAKSATKETGLYFEDHGVLIKPSQIKKSPRIGIGCAGPVWTKKPWRFFLLTGTHSK